jgi:hypothetical protein
MVIVQNPLYLYGNSEFTKSFLLMRILNLYYDALRQMDLGRKETEK